MLPGPRPSPVDEQEKRKRNLLIITGILVLLVVATVFEVGIRAPQIRSPPTSSSFSSSTST